VFEIGFDCFDWMLKVFGRFWKVLHGFF
jgi:hypothetical protein